MIWVAATYERAGAAARAARPTPSSSRAAAAAAGTRRRDRATRTSTQSTPPRRGSAATRATDDVMTLAGSADRQPGGRRAREHLLLPSRRAPRSNNRAALALLRPLVREVARLPELRIEWTRGDWTHERTPDADGRPSPTRWRTNTPPRSSRERLHLPHRAPGRQPAGRRHDLIAPTLPRTSPPRAPPSCASPPRSMLQDDPTYAPYGWTHCLTLPQSVLGITALALRRPTRRPRSRRPTWSRSAPRKAPRHRHRLARPSRRASRCRDALDADPATAASAVFHASDDGARRDRSRARGARRRATRTRTSRSTRSRASPPPRTTPSQRRLYLAAAAYLGAWWTDAGVSQPVRSPATASPVAESANTGMPPAIPNSAMSSADSTGPCTAPSGTSECGRYFSTTRRRTTRARDPDQRGEVQTAHERALRAGGEDRRRADAATCFATPQRAGDRRVRPPCVVPPTARAGTSRPGRRSATPRHCRAPRYRARRPAHASRRSSPSRRPRGARARPT